MYVPASTDTFLNGEQSKVVLAPTMSMNAKCERSLNAYLFTISLQQRFFAKHAQDHAAVIHFIINIVVVFVAEGWQLFCAT